MRLLLQQLRRALQLLLPLMLLALPVVPDAGGRLVHSSHLGYSFAPGVSARAKAGVTALLEHRHDPRPARDRAPAAAKAAAAATEAAATVVVELKLDRSLPNEGFVIQTANPATAASGPSTVVVVVAAASDRGFMLAAGRLRRELRVPHDPGGGAAVGAVGAGAPLALPVPLSLAVSPPAGQIRGTEFTTGMVGISAQCVISCRRAGQCATGCR